MSNKEHLAILEQGVDIWNQWRQEQQGIKPDLIGARLLRANFRGINFQQTRLDVADLASSDIREADFSEASLEDANLGKSNLCQANFTKADLIRVNFNGAELIGTNFSNSILWQAHFHKANLRGTNFRNADLSQAMLDEATLIQANLREANLTMANLCSADLSYADLSGARLVAASVVGANLEGANLTGCSIHGISAWKVKLIDTIQSNLIITDFNEPAITVDNLEIAQFIYLLLEHKKLRDVLNSVVERGVLILGRFGGGGLELLQAIAEKLRQMKYLPIIFDFERPEGRNLTETVMTLVGLSRFVIVDLSGPSVPNELRSTVPHFRIPFVPIIETTRKSYSMFADFLENDWVLSPVEYTSKEHLLRLLPSMVVDSAERKCQERQRRLKQIFNR